MLNKKLRSDSIFYGSYCSQLITFINGLKHTSITIYSSEADSSLNIKICSWINSVT